MKQKSLVIVSLLIFCVTGSLFSLPDEDKYRYEGKIVYGKRSNKLGYIVNRYDSSKRKTKEEIYSKNGQLIKYMTYEYVGGYLSLEKEFDGNNKPLREIKYEYRGDQVSRKTISQRGRKTVYINIEYDYYKNNLLFKLEKYSFLGGGDLAKVYLIKKSVYSQKLNNQLLVEHYRKDMVTESGAKYRYRGAKMYRYGSYKRLLSILEYNQDKKPVKFYEYSYGSRSRLDRVNIYYITQYPLGRSFARSTRDSYSLKQYISYKYSPDAFKSFKPVTSPVTPAISKPDKSGNDLTSEKKGIPLTVVEIEDGKDKPKDDKDKPTDGKTDSPEDGTDSPEDGTDSPEDGTDSPEDGTDSPEDGTDSTEGGTDSPEGGTDSPEGGTDSPEDSTDSPEDSTDSPEDSTDSPEGGTDSPEGGTDSPE